MQPSQTNSFFKLVSLTDGTADFSSFTRVPVHSHLLPIPYHLSYLFSNIIVLIYTYECIYTYIHTYIRTAFYHVCVYVCEFFFVSLMLFKSQKAFISVEYGWGDCHPLFPLHSNLGSPDERKPFFRPLKWERGGSSVRTLNCRGSLFYSKNRLFILFFSFSLAYSSSLAFTGCSASNRHLEKKDEYKMYKSLV